MWAASFSGGLFTFLAQIFIANSLTQAEFGIFAYLFGLTAIFGSVSGFGAASSWLSIFGRRGHKALRLVPATLLYWIITSAISMILYLSVGALTSSPISILPLCLLMVILIPTQGMLDLASSKLQLEGRLLSLATLQLSPHLFRFVAILIAVQLHEEITLVDVMKAIALSSIIVLFISAIQALGILRSTFRFEGHSVSELKATRPLKLTDGLSLIFGSSWSFGLVNVLYLALVSMSTVLIFYLLGDKDAAKYSVAMIFVLAVNTLPSVLFTKVLAASMYRRIHSDRRNLLKEYLQMSKIMLLIGVLFMFTLQLLSPWLIFKLFGSIYSESVKILQILTIAIPLHFSAVGFDVLLVTGRSMFSKIKIMFFLIPFSSFLIIVGATLNGVNGVAIAFVVTQAIALLLYVLAYKRNIFE
jgi:O-antigen/teichoic acid export membrane protein